MEDERYISFIVAPYCLAKLLLSLDISGIYDFAITQVDNDLMVRIPRSYLEKIVYPPKKSGLEQCEGETK